MYQRFLLDVFVCSFTSVTSELLQDMLGDTEQKAVQSRVLAFLLCFSMGCRLVQK